MIQVKKLSEDKLLFFTKYLFDLRLKHLGDTLPKEEARVNLPSWLLYWQVVSGWCKSDPAQNCSTRYLFKWDHQLPFLPAGGRALDYDIKHIAGSFQFDPTGDLQIRIKGH